MGEVNLQGWAPRWEAVVKLGTASMVLNLFNYSLRIGQKLVM